MNRLDRPDRPRSVSSSVAPPSSIREGLRNLFPGKDKTPPALKRALDILRLHDVQALENHFLGTSAFLKPWSHFRDSYLLLHPQSEPRAIAPRRIRGTDILWFYTNFLDGELRYDSRADAHASEFTLDKSKYGTFDNSHWGLEEYEKFLYVWLLQEFKVGKSRNPLGFRYFECRNVCTAWVEVFSPIIAAVKDSYDVKGRRHYGRIATFIEERCPSRLAFPEGNVPEPKSAMPFRLVSFTRERVESLPSEPSPTETPGLTRLIKEREYDTVEAELRNVYPKYGQVIERPKFKTRMEDWLVAQQTRAQHRKRMKDLHGTKSLVLGRRRGGESPLFGCQGINTPTMTPRRSMSLASFSSDRCSPAASTFQQPRTPTHNSAKAKKQAKVPFGMYGIMPKPMASPTNLNGFETPKSPLHGITRPFEVPDSSPESSNIPHSQVPWNLDSQLAQNLDAVTVRDEGDKRFNQPYMQPPELAFNHNSNAERNESGDIYRAICRSIPYNDEGSSVLGSGLNQKNTSETDVASPICPLSAVIIPLFGGPTGARSHSDVTAEFPSTRVVQGEDSQYTGYADTKHEREITSSSGSRKTDAAPERNAYAQSSAYARLCQSPELVHSIAKGRTCEDTNRNVEISQASSPIDPSNRELFEGDVLNAQRCVPQAVPWPGQDSPSVYLQPSWQGAVPSPPPPVPVKNPMRLKSMHDMQNGSLPQPLHQVSRLGTLGPRIISKENIRGRLGISRENSEEDLQHPAMRRNRDSKFPLPSPTLLKTFNSHMFPRQDHKGTPGGVQTEPL